MRAHVRVCTWVRAPIRSESRNKTGRHKRSDRVKWNQITASESQRVGGRGGGGGDEAAINMRLSSTPAPPPPIEAAGKNAVRGGKCMARAAFFWQCINTVDSSATQ